MEEYPDAQWSTSYCRVCFNSCGIRVRTEDGRAVEVTGDSEQPLAKGYTCVKGRSQPALLNDPDRLLHSLKRQPDGSFARIDVEQALDEIAETLRQLLESYGPTSIASYYGTMATTNSAFGSVLSAFMDSIGSPMRFSPNTIDKPGKMVALALHGSWSAPSYEYDAPEVALLFGLNPVVAYQGVPRGNPAVWIRESVRRGMKLIVVDPRRTETARLATTHVQPPPGTDVDILAGLIRIVLTEDLADTEFLAQHVSGADRLREAVEPFTVARVAQRTGLTEDILCETARAFAATRRGYIALGTGPNMSGPGVLLEYLALCLETLCGHWMRTGDAVLNAPTLLPDRDYRAEASDPVPAFGLGLQMSASGLFPSRAGVPISGVPAQIMTADEPSRLRALISCGGNPASAWPDQDRVVESLRNIELLVQIDPWMSTTSRLAHYVIAPKLPLEVPGTTQVPLDNMTLLGNGYGLARSFAQWTDAVVRPPEGSDLIEEWQVYWGLAERLGLSLTLKQQSVAAITPTQIMPGPRPTTEELLTLLTVGSRVPLAEVRRHEHGDEFVDPSIVVSEGRPDGAGRLQVGDVTMMADLMTAGKCLRESASPSGPGSPSHGLRLICRRIQQAYNSSHQHPSTLRGRRYNPAFLHPDDLAELGIAEGDTVEVRSLTGAISAIAGADPNLRRGVVSMTHCFGGLPDDPDDVDLGANICRLLDLDDLQPYSGQPVMSNIPVSVTPQGAP